MLGETIAERISFEDDTVAESLAYLTELGRGSERLTPPSFEGLDFDHPEVDEDLNLVVRRGIGIYDRAWREMQPDWD